MGLLIDSFHSQDRYLAYFIEFPASKFTSVTGGEETLDNTRQTPGGGGPAVVVTGSRQVSDLVLEKPFEKLVDQPMLTRLRAYMRGAQLPLTFTKIPINSAGIPDGAPITYTGCALASIEYPSVQKGDATVAMIRITLSPEDVI